MSAVVLLGGGGHCRSVIDVIEQTGLYSILGVLEKEGFSCSNLMGYPLLGSDHDLPAFIEQNCAVVITIGQIKTSEPREKLYGMPKRRVLKCLWSSRPELTCLVMQKLV